MKRFVRDFADYFFASLVDTLAYVLLLVLFGLVIAPPILAIFFKNALWLLLWLAFPVVVAAEAMIIERWL